MQVAQCHEPLGWSPSPDLYKCSPATISRSNSATVTVKGVTTKVRRGQEAAQPAAVVVAAVQSGKARLLYTHGAHALQLDVTDQASITAAAERIRNEFGRLDVLVKYIIVFIMR